MALREARFPKQFLHDIIDHVGAGAPHAAAFDAYEYVNFYGYAEDVIDIGRELGLSDAVFVGHSGASMIDKLASNAEPELFSRLILAIYWGALNAAHLNIEIC